MIALRAHLHVSLRRRDFLGIVKQTNKPPQRQFRYHALEQHYAFNSPFASSGQTSYPKVSFMLTKRVCLP